MALQRIWIPSPCYHGRNINGVRLIVLHTAEGARTLEDLGHFFQNYNNQVSSHVGADDKLGKIGEYVTRGNAAWTQANYNNAAVALELCGFAAWSTAEWKNNHHNMLRNCADWIAEESKKLNIPITKLSDGAAQGSGRGVCQHKNLGAGGGGHVDCGSGFPMDYVLDMARGGSSQPSPQPPAQWTELMGEEAMQLSLGTDGKAALGIPYNVSHIRLCCAQGAHVNVQWVGSTNRPAPDQDLTGNKRLDLAVPNDQTGQVIIYSGDAAGPISAVWVQKH